MATSHVSNAPDQLGLVQALINSNDLESGHDALATPASMRDWLASQRLASPSGAYDEADRRRLVELRDALHELAAADSGGQRPRRAVTALNEAARRVRLGVRFHPEDGYRVMAEGVGIDRPIGELLAAVTAAMAGHAWERLKVCSNPDCRRAFYDASRNRSARWCSMAVCGNRAKGRNYRRRRSQLVPAMDHAARHTAAAS